MLIKNVEKGFAVSAAFFSDVVLVIIITAVIFVMQKRLVETPVLKPVYKKDFVGVGKPESIVGKIFVPTLHLQNIGDQMRRWISVKPGLSTYHRVVQKIRDRALYYEEMRQHEKYDRIYQQMRKIARQGFDGKLSREKIYRRLRQYNTDHTMLQGIYHSVQEEYERYDELKKYIIHYLGQGVSKEEIINHLIPYNWNKKIIKQAIHDAERKLYKG